MATHLYEPHSHGDQPTAVTALSGPALNRLALTATLHCLSGCAVGEVLEGP